jgi:hypothetical protein
MCVFKRRLPTTEAANESNVTLKGVQGISPPTPSITEKKTPKKKENRGNKSNVILEGVWGSSSPTPPTMEEKTRTATPTITGKTRQWLRTFFQLRTSAHRLISHNTEFCRRDVIPKTRRGESTSHWHRKFPCPFGMPL